MQSDYSQYRGKCKELSEAAVAADASLTLVRGFYFCPIWNVEEQHWWCKDATGKIVDPSAAQYPSKGLGTYREFDGWFSCAECGADVHADDPKAIKEGSYICCSGKCFGRLVGVYCG